MNTFQPAYIIIDKAEPSKKPAITEKCISIGVYCFNDEIGYRKEAFIKVVSGLRIDADAVLLDGLSRCDKKQISSSLNRGDLVAQPNQTIWLWCR